MALPLKRRLDELAARTEKEIGELWRRTQAGLIDRDTFVVLAAVVLGRARMRGIVLADLSVAAAVAQALGDVPEPIGLGLPDGDIDRLETSVRAVLDDEMKTATTPEERVRSQGLRLGRLARDSSAESMTWAMGAAMATHAASGVRIGWIRATGSKPCQMCTNLADGVVRSPEVQMKRHTGDLCVQQVVVEKGNQ